jgi:two-component system, OmpR family, sensor histidine kinase BaeS
LPHIFERFYRGDKSRARKTGGVGIGLSIVKALVEAHKGKISVESELENGSIFTILFPKHEI